MYPQEAGSKILKISKMSLGKQYHHLADMPTEDAEVIILSRALHHSNSDVSVSSTGSDIRRRLQKTLVEDHAESGNHGNMSTRRRGGSGATPASARVRSSRRR